MRGDCKKAAEVATALNRIRYRRRKFTAAEIRRKASCQEIEWYHRELVEKPSK